MTGTAIASALAVLALGLPAPAGDEWVTVRNETETLEFEAPAGFKEKELKNPNIVKHLSYEGPPYLSTQIKAYAYQGQNNLEHFMKFVEKDVGGAVTYEPGSSSRFLSDFQGSDGTWWINAVEGRIEGLYGYYLRCLVPKDIFDPSKDVWIRVLDSMKCFAAPQEKFTLPAPTWKVVKNDMWAVLGPVNEVKDARARQQFENRLFRVSSWLDNSPPTKMFRDLTSDARKWVPKSAIHVHPTPEAFREAAGDRWTEGATVIYLPDHIEKVLLVDGSPDAALQEIDLVAEAGVQYMETRVGSMRPWMRWAFHQYFENGFRARNNAGLFPPEALRKGKEVFGKTPAPFEELLKKDDAGLREMGEDARWVCWGYLQFGLHGNDGAIRNVFRRYLRECVGAPDPEKVWEKSVAAYKDETKRVLKYRDIDGGAKKYFREMKEEKEKK